MNHWQELDAPVIYVIINLVFLILFVMYAGILTKAHIKKIKESLRMEADLALENKELLIATSIEVEERERTRIAAEIHDDIIPSLYALSLRDSSQLERDEISRVINRMRNMSHELYPPLLIENSLPDLLVALTHRFKTHFKVELYLSGEDNNLNKTLKINIYRIVQELLTNIIKHAASDKIELQLRQKPKRLYFVLRDNGKGISKQFSSGLGLRNIDLRADQINATYKIAPNQPVGTKFILTAPVS